MRLQADGITLASDRGELQITDYGLSGIPIFQVSRYAARALDEKKKVRVYVDFMPGWDDNESFRLLKKRSPFSGLQTGRRTIYRNVKPQTCPGSFETGRH